MEMEIGNIVVKSNPRTDFGDIEELTASIREKGVLEPLIVRKLDNGRAELVAGERRLRASKSAGLNNVPVVFYEGDETDIEEVKIIENMHRKDLNAVEEARAFKQYIDTTKTEIDTLAKKISKPKLYIEKRLALLDLPEEAVNALQKNKILLGHALLIARMKDRKAQNAVLKDIINEKRSVAETENRIRYDDNTISLERAVFDKSNCKGCKYNGGEQSLLFETGAELKNTCLDRKCYLKKTAEWTHEQIKTLKEKGTKVLSPANIDSLKVKEQVNKWDDDYKEILKKLNKEPEKYAVVFEENYEGMPEKRIYCLDPKSRRPKTTIKVDEKQTARNASDKLFNKVDAFKREFNIAKIRDIAQPNSKQTKTMVLFALLNSGSSYENRERHSMVEKFIEETNLSEENRFYNTTSFSKILALTEEKIDQHIATISTLWSNDTGEELGKTAEAFGVSLQEHFTIDETYLKLHTKDQLISLAEEIGLSEYLQEKSIEKWRASKRTELIDYFLNHGFSLKGKIPKMMVSGDS